MVLGASHCFWPVHPNLTTPCLPPPQFPGDNRPIHLPLPLRGVQIPFPIPVSQPRVGAAPEALMRELIYRDLNIPCALLACFGTSVIHGTGVGFLQGRRVSISPSQGFSGHSSLCSLHELPVWGSPRFSSFPHPFFPLGSNPKGRRGWDCWQPPHPTAQKCFRTGTIPSGSFLLVETMVSKEQWMG